MRKILPWRRLGEEFSREFEDKQALQQKKEAPQQKKEAPQEILEAPETQGKRTWAEISADADQGSTAANGVGDVGDGDVVTLRPQISTKSGGKELFSPIVYLT